ncbi:hypothetical protein BYT27DRAFT_6425026 [Phlegmacium glaucopus]|nr:hypothetical protein BYT27DRAFT_6425026 [Phlegmacium glaucopus]
MKWKRYGTSYWCTTSGVKGPIAILDLAKGLEPIRLAVYETLYDKYDPQALSAYKGVSILLLDHLIVTALLCVTDVAAWMLLEKVDDVKDIPSRQGADSADEELHYVSKFHNHPYAMASGKLRRTPSDISLTSLATSVSRSVTAFPRSLEPYGTRTPTYLESDASKRYSEPFALPMEDWSRDYWPPLPSIKPSSSPEYSLSPTVKTLIHSSQNIPPVPPIPSQFANVQPRASTSSQHEFPLLHDQPHTATIHSQLPSRKSSLGPEKRHSSFSSKQPPNVSNPTHPVNRSASQRRPLPKPPTESGICCMQSSTQLSVKLSRDSHTRQIRSLPITPRIESYSSDKDRGSVAEGNTDNTHQKIIYIT